MKVGFATKENGMLMHLSELSCDSDQTQPAWDDAATGDERELIERFKNDVSVVAVLYRRHHEAIALYILRRVGCVHETEDLTAETFVAMVKYLPSYRFRGLPFRSWLYRLATTQVNRWARRKRRLVLKEISNPEKIANREISDEDGHVDTTHVRLALLSLPPRFQTVISLHYMERMSVASIAETLGCSVGTVKSRLARGRDKLRHQIRKMVRTNDF